MAGNAFEIWIAFYEAAEDFVLLFVSWLKRNTVFPVTLGMVILIFPEMVWFDAEKYIYIRQT